MRPETVGSGQTRRPAGPLAGLPPGGGALQAPQPASSWLSSLPCLRDADTVALPLDYYKMLGVSGVCSRDSLARALEKWGLRSRAAQHAPRPSHGSGATLAVLP